jgi:NADPH:quinone reductase-like Zn-dependent oxidoreductase
MTPSTDARTGAPAPDSTRTVPEGGTRAVPDGGAVREDRALTAAVSPDDVVLVTGSTDGIGREVARNLADAGATVLVHGRDREKAERAVSGLPGDGHDYYLADFADLSAVRDLAADVRADVDRLDVLVNNAGTWQGERRLTGAPGARTWN